MEQLLKLLHLDVQTGMLTLLNGPVMWFLLLVSFLLALAAIWFVYDPIAALCRVRLTKDATQMQRIMEASFVPMTLERCAEILAQIFWGITGVIFLVSAFAGKPNIFVALVAGLLGYVAANVLVRRQTKLRLEVFERQLPDVLTMMSNTLKSGLTLQQSLDLCSREMSRPASHEFFLVMQEIKVGATPEEALLHLSERMPLQEVEMLVTTVATLRQAGGNLTESFETIARVIKERNAVKGKIKALTAEAMFQGKLLAFLPFIFMAMLYFTSKEFILPLFIDPIGWAIIVAIILLVSFGYWVMVKLVTIDV